MTIGRSSHAFGPQTHNGLQMDMMDIRDSMKMKWTGVDMLDHVVTENGDLEGDEDLDRIMDEIANDVSVALVGKLRQDNSKPQSILLTTGLSGHHRKGNALDAALSCQNVNSHRQVDDEGSNSLSTHLFLDFPRTEHPNIFCGIATSPIL